MLGWGNWMQLTLFWLEAILDFPFVLPATFIHEELSCEVHVVVAVPSSLPFAELFSTTFCFEQKLSLFWINLFSSGGIYTVLTDKWRNPTCPLGHELSRGSTDVSAGCWDPPVHGALAADVPRSPCPPQRSPEPRLRWYGHLCRTLVWHVLAGSENCQQHHKDRSRLS